MISNKQIIGMVRDRLASIRVLAADPNNCPTRMVHQGIDWVMEQLKSRKLKFSDAGTTIEELDRLWEQASHAQEGN